MQSNTSARAEGESSLVAQWKRSISDGKHLPGPGGPSAEAAGQVSRRRGREGGLWLGILPECLGRLHGCVFYTGHHRGWGLCGSHSHTLCCGCKQKDWSWFRATFWKCCVLPSSMRSLWNRALWKQRPFHQSVTTLQPLPPPNSPPELSESVLHSDKPRKVTVAAAHRQQVVYQQAGSAVSQEWAECLGTSYETHWGFVSTSWLSSYQIAPRKVTTFTRRDVTSSEGGGACTSVAPLSPLISFSDQVNSACVCVGAVFLCAQLHVHSVWMCIERTWIDTLCLPWSLFNLFFETGSLTDPRVPQFS